MEIGIIIAIILLAFTFVASKSSAGIVVVELAKLLWSALMLGFVLLYAFLRPKRPSMT